MPYLIDSDWLIDYLLGYAPAVELLRSLSDDGTAISVITYMETLEGIQRSDDVATAGRGLDLYMASTPVLPVTENVAARCAAIRIALRARGGRVSPRALDLLIAATAQEYRLTIVTRNRADYADIPGVSIYSG